MHGLAKKLEKALTKRERKALRKESIERRLKMQYDFRDLEDDCTIRGTTPFSRAIMSELANMGWRKSPDVDYD